MTARGQCNCGAVAFEIAAPVRDVYICHCSICRRFSGANAMAVLVVANDALRWLRGQDSIASWSKPGADWQSWFCATCGSAVPGRNDARTMFVPAGLIDEGGAGLRVAHHIWVGSKAVWDEIGDRGQQHGEGFTSPAGEPA